MKVKKNVDLAHGLLLCLLILNPLSAFNQPAVGQPTSIDGISREASKFPSLVMSDSDLRLNSTDSTPVVMSPSRNDVNLYVDRYDQDQPTIAVNPLNPLNLAAGSHDASTAKPTGTTLWTITYRSLDGGATWSRSYVPRAGPIVLFTRAKDPVVDFDGFGIAYFAALAFMRGGTYDASIWVARSTDGGLTYDIPVMVDGGHGSPGTPFFEFNDKPCVATDKRTSGTGAGYVYVTWTSFVDVNGDGWEDTYHILFSRSTDGGATFSAPVLVSDVSNSANQLSQVAVGLNGEICVSWVNWNNPTTRILFDKSDDFGVSFGTDVEVQSFKQIPNLPYIERTSPSISIATDTSGGAYHGYIYITYPVDPSSTTDFSDAMFTRSTNSGGSWSTPTRLNDDSTSNDQFFPAIAVDPGGSIKVAWYDRRLDPSDRYIDVFQTESNDGGLSFAANTKVTDTSFDPAGNFLGDHIDIGASSTQVHPVWTDRRNGNNDVYTEYAPQGHELSVSLEAPTILEPRDSTKLNATVYNIGSSDETNVELRLLINGTVVNSTLIPELLTSSSYTLRHLWIPTVEGIYNVTAYAPPVPSEALVSNNNASKSVQVRILPDILIVADDDASNRIQGTSLPEFESALGTANYDYWVWKESVMDQSSLEFLLKFELVIWTSGDYWAWAVDPTDAEMLEAYLNEGGNILLEGEDIGFDHRSDSLMVNVAHALYETDDTEALELTVTDSTHPVTQGLPRSFAWITTPPAADGVTPTNGGFEVIGYKGTGWTAVTVFDGIATNRGSVVYYAFPIYSLAQPERDTLIINSVSWLLPPIAHFTHSPEKPISGEVVTFNATSSTSNDGIITNYEWNFGDTNTTATTNPIITHTYNAPGNYNATLTVTNSEGKNGAAWSVIIVYIAGDIDRDEDVDASDLFYLGKAYDSTPASSNWNQLADLNKDNIVNVIDLDLLKKNYGKTT